MYYYWKKYTDPRTDRETGINCSYLQRFCLKENESSDGRKKHVTTLSSVTPSLTLHVAPSSAQQGSSRHWRRPAWGRCGGNVTQFEWCSSGIWRLPWERRVAFDGYLCVEKASWLTRRAWMVSTVTGSASRKSFTVTLPSSSPAARRQLSIKTSRHRQCRNCVTATESLTDNNKTFLVRMPGHSAGGRLGRINV